MTYIDFYPRCTCGYCGWSWAGPCPVHSSAGYPATDKTIRFTSCIGRHCAHNAQCWS